MGVAALRVGETLVLLVREVLALRVGETLVLLVGEVLALRVGEKLAIAFLAALPHPAAVQPATIIAADSARL